MRRRLGDRAPRSTLVLSLILIFSSVVPAMATNWGATAESGCGYYWGVSDDSLMTNCVSTANNEWHAVRFYSLGNQWPGIDTATTWAVNNVYNPTDLTAYVTSTDNYPDVRVWDWDYGDIGVIAWVDCPADNTGVGYRTPGQSTTRWCRGQILRFNGSYSADYDTTGEARALACHELGHTVGLRHITDTADCLYTPFLATSHSTSLTSHSILSVDYYYP